MRRQRQLVLHGKLLNCRLHIDIPYHHFIPAIPDGRPIREPMVWQKTPLLLRVDGNSSIKRMREGAASSDRRALGGLPIPLSLLIATAVIVAMHNYGKGPMGFVTEPLVSCPCTSGAPAMQRTQFKARRKSQLGTWIAILKPLDGVADGEVQHDLLAASRNGHGSHLTRSMRTSDLLP